MSAFAQQQSIAFRANVVAKSVSSKKQSKKIQLECQHRLIIVVFIPSLDGYYKGRKVIKDKVKTEEQAADSAN